MTAEADRRALMDAVVPGSYEAQQRKEAEEAAQNASLRLLDSTTTTDPNEQYRLREPQPVQDDKVAALSNVVRDGTLPLHTAGRTQIGIAVGHDNFEHDIQGLHEVPHHHGKTGGVYINFKF